MNKNQEIEKERAILRLLYELNMGKLSGKKEGYLSSDEMRAYVQNKMFGQPESE
ncbi:MAG: hypothetical protein J6U05_03870 [Neisseriaceae bacterium]|nr:hypothetical protein [Neisseriaceae bacterium]MBO7555026.1 hypothetical protein [Neisseriaceae bacterium]